MNADAKNFLRYLELRANPTRCPDGVASDAYGDHALASGRPHGRRSAVPPAAGACAPMLPDDQRRDLLTADERRSIPRDMVRRVRDRAWAPGLGGEPVDWEATVDRALAQIFAASDAEEPPVKNRRHARPLRNKSTTTLARTLPPAKDGTNVPGRKPRKNVVTAAQSRFIDFVLQGHAPTAASALAGASPSVGARWITKPHVQAEIHRRERMNKNMRGGGHGVKETSPMNVAAYLPPLTPRDIDLIDRHVAAAAELGEPPAGQCAAYRAAANINAGIDHDDFTEVLLAAAVHGLALQIARRPTLAEDWELATEDDFRIAAQVIWEHAVERVAAWVAEAKQDSPAVAVDDILIAIIQKLSAERHGR